MMSVARHPLAAALMVTMPAIAIAQAPIPQERVQFARGTTSKTLGGTIRGYASRDYIVGARAGQTMTVTLKTPHRATYFNVLPPGSNDVAIHIGQIAGNSFKARLDKGGDYKLRVYMMRSAARRNERANYAMTVGITGPAAAARSVDALVPGTRYHATATVPCKSAAGQPMGSCRAGVIRNAGGESTVHLDTPDGGERYIYFNGTRATSSDSGAPMRVERDSDLSIIRIGEYERYEIPDALVVGG
jgi:hypothetical protein